MVLPSIVASFESPQDAQDAQSVGQGIEVGDLVGVSGRDGRFADGESARACRRDDLDVEVEAVAQTRKRP
jgi:hypothetical protein